MRKIRPIISVLAFVLAVVIGFGRADRAKASTEEICPAGQTSPLAESLKDILLTYEGCPEEMGAWYMLPMPPEAERMQAVHSVLLPNNKVLIASGSSNRNRITAEGKLEDGVNSKNYDVTNNTAIFDPSLSDPFYKGSGIEADFSTNPFRRIDSPPNPLVDPETGTPEANDLFCSGHLHLPDGKVMFAGGSRLYYPGIKFQGSKLANIFNWEDESWKTPHFMTDGHWYPSLIPLHNGAIAVISGLPAGRFNQVSTLVEIYDPNQEGTGKEWQSIDIRDLPNSPFNTRMLDVAGVYDLDYIDLYPSIFPVKNASGDTFLITGEGDGKAPTVPQHTSFRSYFMTFTKDSSGEYEIEFQPGPQRQGVTKVYGTTSLDPTSENGDVLLYGGVIGTNDLNLGPGGYTINGATISADLERWHAPTDFDPESEKGYWELYPDFLANIDEDIIQKTIPGSFPLQYRYEVQQSQLGSYGKRTMALAVILPTKQILLVNGGNYPERHPVFNPTLMTLDETKTGGWSTKRMNPDEEARMYHNTALLLPDARVLVMGGNPSRAARKDDGTVVTSTIRDFEFVPNGVNFLSAEVYRHAIFYPPYLFGSGPRPEIETDIQELNYGAPYSIEVSNGSGGFLVLNKLGSVTHTFDSGQRLVDLNVRRTFSAQNGNTKIEFTGPTNRLFSPPGYYMLFYVNDEGVPSHAKILRLS